jgi:hypothetical protein
METKTSEWEATTKKNVKQLAYWTLAWVLTVAIATFGPKFIWNSNPVISGIFILINALVGIGMILMNRKYINSLDEMHRKVNLDAMALALGVAVVGGLSYSMLDIANVIPYDAEIAFLLVLISLTYFIGVIAGNARYK